MKNFKTVNGIELAALLAALLAIAAIMWPALSGGFIFDDYSMFADNETIQRADWTWQAWRNIWIWSQQHIQRPTAMFSYALNYAFGSTSWGFKATNLVIHLFNTILLFVFAKRLLLVGWIPRNGDDNLAHARRAGLWALTLVTAWAVHPLQISTVMYVVQRMEMLSFTFTLLALLAYWRARQQQMIGNKRGWPWLLLCGVLTVIGYSSKETSILVPGYALLLELTVLRFNARSSLVTQSWKIIYIIGCIAGVALFAFYLLPHYAPPAAFSGRDFNAWERTLTQLRVLPMYIGWCLLPLPTHMHFYYDNFVVSTGWLHPVTTLLGGLFLLGLLGLAITMRNRRPLLTLGIGWFFVAHALTSAPLPLELVFEHRNYPALFGVLLAVADLLWFATRRAHPRLPSLLASILLISLGFFTTLRAATWGNPTQLAITLAHDNPRSPRASYDLALRYMQLSRNNTNSPMYARAVAEFQRSASLPGSSPLPEQALILMAAGNGMPIDPSWWVSFLHKLQVRPISSQEFIALNALATKRVNDNVTAIDDIRLKQAFEIMIQRKPKRVTWRVQYADLASLALHDEKLAIKQLFVALELKNGAPDFSRQLTRYLANNHRYAEALAVIGKAQTINPDLRTDTQLLTQKAKIEYLIQSPVNDTNGL